MSLPWTTGRVVVRYRRGVGIGARRQMASVAGATRRAPLGHLGAEELTTADAAATIRRLRGQEEVLWAEPEQRRYRAQATSAAQTELSVPAAWATEPRMRGAGVEVAVIDDGVDPGNPDLSGSGKVVDGGDCSGDSCLASGGLAAGRRSHAPLGRAHRQPNWYQVKDFTVRWWYYVLR